jgi:hypothetical protein
MEMVKVINNNEMPLHGRFDGKDFTFVPSKPTFISIEAAKHIFDLGKEDKSQALNMLGLLKANDLYEDALKKLDRVSFLKGHTVYEDEGEASEEAEETNERPRARNRTGGRPHVAGPGGDTGAEYHSSAPENPG